MQPVVVLPGLIATLVAWRTSPQRALAFVCLPCLLLLPAYYTFKAPGIPQLTFHNYMLLGVASVWALRGPRLKLRWLDLLVAFFGVTAVASEFENRDFHEARNLAAHVIMVVGAPYLLGRMAAAKHGTTVAALGALVVIGAAIGWASPWEARMGNNPFDLWRSVWPVHVPWDGALYRSGLRRVAGPFAHPICHGFFFSMALPIALWLFDQGLPHSKRTRWILGAGLVLGLLLSQSRGPMLGAAIACAVARVGWSSRRVLITATGALLLAFAGLFTFDAVSRYAAVDRSSATTESQETVAYRKEMIARYVEVVEERPLSGYGRYQIPVVAGLKSIDNQYLFLALTHGVPHAAAFVLILLGAAGVLGWRLAHANLNDPTGRLGWALVGLLLGSVLTQATVFAGTQTAQLLLFFVGLALGVSERLSTRPSQPGIQDSLPSSFPIL